MLTADVHGLRTLNLPWMLFRLKISEIDISSQNWEVGYVCNLFCSAYPVAVADGVERATALQCDKIDSLDNIISRGCD